MKGIRICKVKGGDVSKMLLFESAIHFCIKPFRVSTCIKQLYQVPRITSDQLTAVARKVLDQKSALCVSVLDVT